MTDLDALTPAQLRCVAEAAHTLVRGCWSGPGGRCHRGEDEWALLGALDGERPATERQKRGGRAGTPAVQAKREDGVRMLRDGFTRRAIAAALGVSQWTVARWAQEVPEARRGGDWRKGVRG
jgi:DNA invertase Pin-like site-specific DNA recombinase